MAPPMKKRWLSIGVVALLFGVLGVSVVGGCGSDAPVLTQGSDRSQNDASDGPPSTGSRDAGGDDDPTDNPTSSDSGMASSDLGTVPCGPAECATPSQICCTTVSPDGGLAGTCEAAGTNCKLGAASVACDEPSDCASGSTCCLAFAGLGSSCAATCILQSAVVCKDNQDCPDAGTCKEYSCLNRPQRACSRSLGCD